MILRVVYDGTDFIGEWKNHVTVYAVPKDIMARNIKSIRQQGDRNAIWLQAPRRFFQML